MVVCLVLVMLQVANYIACCNFCQKQRKVGAEDPCLPKQNKQLRGTSEIMEHICHYRTFPRRTISCLTSLIVPSMCFLCCAIKSFSSSKPASPPLSLSSRYSLFVLAAWLPWQARYLSWWWNELLRLATGLESPKNQCKWLYLELEQKEEKA